MPTRHRALTPGAAAAVVAESFCAHPDPLCGIELEWPVHVRDTGARPTHEHLLAATADPLPGGSAVTIEPGGQVELSTLPVATPDEALDVATVDTAALHHRLAGVGLDAADCPVDTRRVPQRILRAPRYACMEAFFAARGDAGAWMMCNTASLQVNLGHDPMDPGRRWALAHRLGPVLVATFANSPGVDAAGRRWESMRQAIWWSIDPGRSRPPRTPASGLDAWLHYALAADVMLIRSPDGGAAVAVPPGFPFGRWLADGHPAGWPTAEDLGYHLTTLFPPVRPRGWLELRMLDLLPPGLRDVATIVALAALTTDAARELEARIPATDGLWCAAARHGLAHPDLAAAARILFDGVLAVVESVTVDQRRRDGVRAFADSHVARGVSPAQLVDAARLGTALGPTLEPGSAVGSALAGRRGQPDRPGGSRVSRSLRSS